jgi:hypothetical protein
MPDPKKPLTYDQLPPRVRQDFESIRKTLGPELTIGNLRAVSDGWVVSIFTLDGVNGGDYLVHAQPGEMPQQ